MQPPLDDSDSIPAFLATNPTNTTCCSELWHIDSGASAHATDDISNLYNIRIPGGHFVGIGGVKCEIKGVGDMKAKVKTSTGEQVVIKICDVRYVPQLEAKLLSIPSLMKRGNTVTFNSETEAFIDSGEHKYAATELNGDYYLNMKIINDINASNEYFGALLATSLDMQLWHRRLGHYNSDSVKQALIHACDDNKRIKFTNNAPNAVCGTCAINKSHRRSFSTYKRDRSTQPFELMYTDIEDVAGTTETKTHSGYRYIILFMDDCTRYMWIRLLKSKSTLTSLQ
jgi:GAG-pre-integrase domain